MELFPRNLQFGQNTFASQLGAGIEEIAHIMEILESISDPGDAPFLTAILEIAIENLQDLQAARGHRRRKQLRPKSHATGIECAIVFSVFWRTVTMTRFCPLPRHMSCAVIFSVLSKG